MCSDASAPNVNRGAGPPREGTPGQVPGRFLRASRLRYVLGTTATLAFILVTSSHGAGPRFYPDDPISVDHDALFDASGAKPIELSETFDFLENTFGSPGSPGNNDPGRALNLNTLDEVPNSSWFTNRIGRRPMSIAEIVRGPDKFERLDVDEWLITGGKSPGGLQPGFRAVDPRHPEQLYQLEVDPPSHPELASGAEIIGTALYHAMGYNVVDVYLVNVDPKKITISKKATIRDASGRRAFVQGDRDEILRFAARNADGTYRMIASRFAEGAGLGNFKYFGTRPDDPNDIYPHEHRRELRANRVFSAWVNHDDSRAINTLDMLVSENGRKYVRHYMFDFGSILGSATRFADTPRSGHAYLLERRSNLARLLTFGLWLQPWQFIDYPDDLPSAVGRIQGDVFDPEQWKPEYPNQAFRNLRPDDAFWGARIVAAFSDEAIAAVVKKAQYTDPRATEYLTSVLIKRRDKIAKVWLNAVNPVVDFQLAPDGTLTFENAAIKATAATPGRGYTLSWSRFDNAADAHEPIGSEQTVSEPRVRAPLDLLKGSEYVAVTVRGHHPEDPAWAQPVRAYFRPEGVGWKTVGLERLR